jgi:hypothetical protein
MPFPAGLTTITVTGLNILALDGTALSGTLVFAASGLVADPAVSALLKGNATATVTNGVMTPVVLATTDCISPGFTYTVTASLQSPSGLVSFSSALVASGVVIPSGLGSSVDVSALVPGSGAVPPVTAFGSSNTWTAAQTFAGTPALIMPSGAVSGYVWTAAAGGAGSWQPAASGGAPLASPAFTGSPTAPTQAAGDATTKIATDAFVAAAVAVSAAYYQRMFAV